MTLTNNLLKGTAIAVLLAITASVNGQSPESRSQHTEVNDRLYYNAPAAIWEETLPLGNGRLGMMPDGGIDIEHIVLNELSMWSGCEADYSNPDAAKSLPEIRRLLTEGRNDEAQELMYSHFVPKKETADARYGCYQVLAGLDIRFSYPGHEMASVPWHDVELYERGLSLADAVARTGFSLDGTAYSREYFVSRDRDVIIVMLSASGTAKLSFTAELGRAERASARADGSVSVLEGSLDSGIPGKDGMRYIVMMKAVCSEGKHFVSHDGRIHVEDADTAWLVLSATTSYHAEGTDFPGDRYREVCRRKLNDAVTPLSRKKEQAYSSMIRSHTDSHKQLYGRVRIQLPTNADDSLPTDIRLRKAATPGMAELYCNFGRYLLISSTRPGSLPPNLQGLWADSIATPWNGDYHTNINLQMNYWPMEQAGLQELIQPLETFIERLVTSGEESAKAFYGEDAKGWVLHMMTNIWNYTAPGEHPSWGATNTGGAWLCAHLWDHYRYTLDNDFLRRIYPVMKGAAEFFMSTMITEPVHGWLVTAPSSSPENRFIMNGKEVSICMGSAMDVQILTELFRSTAEAASILGTDKAFADSLSDAVRHFPPMQTGHDGRLMEWMEEYQEAEPHHRHVSHLYGLHPGSLISPDRTPELAEASRKSLAARGDEGTGWSRAWKICFWARLGDGNHAWKLFSNLLAPAVSYSVLDSLHRAGARPEAALEQASGTFPNMFCSHDPFQIDGNFGGASGIAEMLLQSHEGYIRFIPALPSGWTEGSVTGMCVRGDASVDFSWKGGILQNAVIHAGSGHGDIRLIIKVPDGLAARDLYSSEYPSDSSGFIYLQLAPGESRTIIFR